MIIFAAKNTISNSMRRNLWSLGVLLSVAFLFASCLSSNDEDVVLYDDTAITSFYISNANIKYHTTSSTGNDSTYTKNISMSAYPFCIDHVKGLIYNVDSLPVGTDAAKLLCSYSTKSNGVVYIETVNRDSMNYLSTTDSLDFTSPRYLRVYASDLSAYRTYTVMVNVHKEAAGSFKWTHVADNDDIAASTGLKAVASNGRILLFASDGSRTVVYSTGESDGSVWEQVGATLNGDAYKNVATRDDTIYVLDNNILRKSTDGATFENVGTVTCLSQLVGASTSELYGLGTNGRLMVSADNGATWNEESLDDSQSLLPSSDVAFCSAAFGGIDSTDYVMLAGSRSVEDYPSDANAVVWSKIVEYSSGSESNQWTYIDAYGACQLPRLANLNVFAYGSRLLAFGGAGIGGCTENPFSNIYESRDGGITWKPNSSYALPAAFDRDATYITAVVDSSDNIWLFCSGTGQIWRGKLNSIGWNK